MPAPTLPDPPGRPAPRDSMRSLGFDPEAVQAVILTADAAIAIAIDYPEPHNPPEV